MQQLSVVIICKNEASYIQPTIEAALQLTQNIIVVDTGSTDDTIAILKKLNVTIIESNWLGFGPTKNIGINAATKNWIISIDADEIMDKELINAIKKLDLDDEKNTYKFNFLNYLGNAPLHFGEWSNDKHIRMFNKKNTQWNNAIVHEELVYLQKPNIKTIAGKIHHKTVPNRKTLHIKLENYAKLNAQNYLTKGKKNAIAKKILSPVFNFLKNYIFKLGFLDGKAGLIVAYENAIYTFKKYNYLQQLQNVCSSNKCNKLP